MSGLQTRMMMILAALAAVAAPPVQAGRAMGVSGNPDAKAHFVLAEQPANADPDAIVMLRVENGASHYEENVPIEIDVLFAKADLAKIKWCTYRTTPAEMVKSAKTCKPSMAIEAGRSYTIR